METKYVKVPFELELAKKITGGEVEGKIVTRDGRSVRIVCWDLKSIKNDYSILAIINDAKEENPLICTFKGLFDIEAESRNDLMLEIPEYMTFKDGDMIAYDDRDAIVILKGELKIDDSNIIGFRFYVNMFGDDLDFYGDRVLVCVNSARKATPEEIEKLKNRLVKDDRQEAKKCLKRFFGIEQKQGYEFKPKDWVLCRNGDEEWCLCRFSHVTVNVDRELLFVAVGGIFYSKCIPYNEQTKHLLGTTENWEE